MDINEVAIKLLKYDDLVSSEVDGLRHVKRLPYVSVVRATEGEYTVRFDNSEEYRVSGGGMFIAPSGVLQDIVHHTDSESGIMRADWVFIDARINGTFAPDDLFVFPYVLSRGEGDRLSCDLDMLRDAADACDRMIAGYRIVKHLIEASISEKKVSDKRMQAVCDYIHANYREKLTVACLARIAGMSESNFYSAFRKTFASSPVSYLNDYRISVASDMLFTEDKNISDIAQSVGFDDPYYFSRVFSSQYGIPPTEYRRKMKNK